MPYSPVSGLSNVHVFPELSTVLSAFSFGAMVKLLPSSLRFPSVRYCPFTAVGDICHTLPALSTRYRASKSSGVVICTLFSCASFSSVNMSSVFVTFIVTSGQNGASRVTGESGRSNSFSTRVSVPSSSNSAEARTSASFLISRLNFPSLLPLTLSVAENFTLLPAMTTDSPFSPFSEAFSMTGASGLVTTAGSSFLHENARTEAAARIKNDFK